MLCLRKEQTKVGRSSAVEEVEFNRLSRRRIERSESLEKKTETEKTNSKIIEEMEKRRRGRYGSSPSLKGER